MGLKSEEFRNPDSCLNKASPHEPIFVLRGQDPAAAATIRFWCDERQRLGIDWPESGKQIEARLAANSFDVYPKKE